MLRLRSVSPPGKFQSTVKGLKMHHISDWAFDVSEHIRLGGQFATRLDGITPRGLVPDNVQTAQPPADFDLPLHTKPSGAARNRNNWRIAG